MSRSLSGKRAAAIVHLHSHLSSSSSSSRRQRRLLAPSEHLEGEPVADGPGPRARPQAPEPYAGDGMAAEIQAQGEEMTAVGATKVSAGGQGDGR